MPMQDLRVRTFALAAGFVAMMFAGFASADPPSRVARLGEFTGPVSFSPAGESDWVQAAINRPLTTGDRVWVDAGARAELQVGGAMIRMNDGTGVTVLNLDDAIAQLQLTQGTLNVRVRSLAPSQTFEVDTPNLAFTLTQPGEYRIQVDPDGSATTIVVRKGQGNVYGENASYVVDSRQPYRFMGTDLREYQTIAAPRLDEFDQWATDRDRRYDASISARYVSQDVVGYQDLDANGTWRSDATYGNVWVPTRVAAGWAPYRDGHWAWVDPWGWTWVDDAPWGFAVSHYGRWTNLRGTWGWVPGPMNVRPYYAPALVAFVGGNGFQIAISTGNVGAVAWFPLGPREIYRPSYAASRGYYENVNRSNTIINTTVINNTYNNTNVTNIVYANRQVAGAVVAVPTTVFTQSQQVGRAAMRVTPAMLASAPIAVAPAVVPTERSVRGAASPGDKPPARVFERPSVARTPPPAAPVAFAAQQQQLLAARGKPLGDAARKELKPLAAVPSPVVKVVGQNQVAPPTARPPVMAANAKATPAMAPIAPVQPGGPKAAPFPSAQPGLAGAAPSNAPPAKQVPPPIATPAPAFAERGQPEARGPVLTPPPVPEKNVVASPTGTRPVAARPDASGAAAPTTFAAPSAAHPLPVTPPPPMPVAQRAAEPKAFLPPSAPPAAMTPVPPKPALPPQSGRTQFPVPPSPMNAVPAPAPVAKPAGAPPQFAAPKQPPLAPQPQGASAPRGGEQKIPPGKKEDPKSAEQQREEELRKQKGLPPG
jgi:hypothetical protein